MIGRRICTFRKLTLLFLAIAVAFLFTMKKHGRSVLLTSKDGAVDSSEKLLSRLVSSQILPAKGHSLNYDEKPGRDFTKSAMPNEKELKSIGIEIISDPLDLRLQVHPAMLEKDAEDVFHRYVAELHVECRRHVRLGNTTDGGWDMCVAGPYLPSKGSCLVFSFGIGDNWSFDDDVSERFGCTVRSFDPSINSSDHQRSPRISFHHVGLGSDNLISSGGWHMMTLSSILSLCRDEGKTIDYMKIDIESYEWDALEQILSTGNLLSNVKQLAIELHTKELDRVQSTKEDLVRYWTILHHLELAGFRRWYWHFNLWGFFPSRTLEKYLSCCYEVVYININYLNRGIINPTGYTGH